MGLLRDIELGAQTDPLWVALEASCQALFALQMACGGAGDESRNTDAELAFSSLRQAIDHLRILRGERRSPLGYGFVDCGPSAASGQTDPEADQSSP